VSSCRGEIAFSKESISSVVVCLSSHQELELSTAPTRDALKLLTTTLPLLLLLPVLLAGARPARASSYSVTDLSAVCSLRN